MMLRDGDYVPDGRGGFRQVAGAEELLQRVLWKLNIRRGSFPFLPDLGSRLYLLLREKAAARELMARQYAAEALADEADLTVTGVVCASRADGGCDLTVFLEWRGEPLQTAVRI